MPFFPQAYELLVETLFDASEKVAKTSREVFLPSFAIWAQDLDRVESHLFTSLVSNLENTLKVQCMLNVWKKIVWRLRGGGGGRIFLADCQGKALSY